MVLSTVIKHIPYRNIQFIIPLTQFDLYIISTFDITRFKLSNNSIKIGKIVPCGYLAYFITSDLMIKDILQKNLKHQTTQTKLLNAYLITKTMCLNNNLTIYE